MRAARVVELDMARNRAPRFAHRVVGSEVYLLVLQRLPEALDEHVVAPCPLAVHADGNAMALELLRELQARELAALVGIHDLGLAVAGHGLLQRLHAEVCGQRVRESECQNPAARPVHDGAEVHEAPAHRDIGDVQRPDLVGPLARHVSEQIGVDRMLGVALAC